MTAAEQASPSLEVAVLGTGSYGTCLAKLMVEAGHKVTLWSRSSTVASELTLHRENRTYLPGVLLPDSLTITADLAAAVHSAQLVLGVLPSFATRDFLQNAQHHFRSDAILVNASKGLEEDSLLRMDQVYSSVLGPAVLERTAFLSGPTFAKEVAQGKPSAIVAAAQSTDTARFVQKAMSNQRFRVYSSSDVVGVELGGALKNVMAICAGVSDGLELGNNARAALITRGLAEIARIGVAEGANPLTFSGLSGMGDLVLTCTGDLSRNRQVGLALARGQTLATILAQSHMVAEGIKTARAARALAARVGVQAPLTEFICGVLFDGKPVREGISELMTRSLKSELA